MINVFVSPFSLAVDGITGKEAQLSPTTLSRLMVVKTEEPILHVKGWDNVRIAIVVVALYYWIICEAQFQIPLLIWEPDWDLGFGLGFTQ